LCLQGAFSKHHHGHPHNLLLDCKVFFFLGGGGGAWLAGRGVFGFSIVRLPNSSVCGEGGGGVVPGKWHVTIYTWQEPTIVKSSKECLPRPKLLAAGKVFLETARGRGQMWVPLQDFGSGPALWVPPLRGSHALELRKERGCTLWPSRPSCCNYKSTTGLSLLQAYITSLSTKLWELFAFFSVLHYLSCLFSVFLLEA